MNQANLALNEYQKERARCRFTLTQAFGVQCETHGRVCPTFVPVLYTGSPESKTVDQKRHLEYNTFMLKKPQVIKEMARAIERERCRSARYWTEDQFNTWCHKEPVGIRSFKKSMKLAKIAYKSLILQGIIKA